MRTTQLSDITRILDAIDDGDAQRAEELLPIVYEELRRLASHRMAKERPGQTLQATALVHEAYLRLVGEASPRWDSRAHFFAAAAEAMRRILIDKVRRKGRAKHGGERRRVDLSHAELTADGVSEDVLALDDALTALAKEDPVKADLVKLRFYAGQSLSNAAALLGISTSTAGRHWAYARAWLYRRIQGSR